MCYNKKNVPLFIPANFPACKLANFEPQAGLILQFLQFNSPWYSSVLVE